MVHHLSPGGPVMMLLVTIGGEKKSFVLNPSPTIKQGHAKGEQRGGITPGLGPARLLHPTPAPNASGATPRADGRATGQPKGWKSWRWAPTRASSVRHSTKNHIRSGCIGVQAFCWEWKCGQEGLSTPMGRGNTRSRG